MSLRKYFPAAAVLVAGAAVAAPILFADDKPDHPRSPAMDARTGDELKLPPGHLGFGKGTILMPVMASPGTIIGVLTECDGPCKFMFEGELTGFMPSDGLSGGAQYWFGGLYGVMTEVVTGPAPDREHAKVLQVEGMWQVDKYLDGSFTAQILATNEAGNPYVCGIFDGRFRVSEAMPGPEPGPGRELGLETVPAADRLGVRKATKGPAADLASQGGVIVCPKEKVPPAGQAPRNVRRAADAADGTQPCSIDFLERPGAFSTGTPYENHWPVLMGTFDLRYQLYE